MNTYPIQELVGLSVLFTDAVSNLPVDPTLVTLTVTAPDDTNTEYLPPDIVRDSIGAYHYNIAVNLVGLYIYRWQGTGAVIASSGNGFFQGA
jgi:hypothetical protein